jgi:hypothetical protein
MTDAGWHADPIGAHEHRWWDGTTWTAHVADGGVASTDPLPDAAATAQDPGVAIERSTAALQAAVDGAGLPEHPKVELSTAVGVAGAVLTLLVVNPEAAETFGVGFPDDPGGARLLAAAELHGPAIDPGGLPSALRVLAFHVLLVLSEDRAAAAASASALGVDGERWTVAAALGEQFRAVTAPPDDEWSLLHELYRSSPGRGWDPAYYGRIHAHLLAQLLPTAGGGGDDAPQLLWAAVNAILQPYAIALFPDLVGS